MQSWKSCKL